MLVLQTHSSLEGVCLSPGGLGDRAPGCVCCRDESVITMSWGCELGETQWEGLGSGLGRWFLPLPAQLLSGQGCWVRGVLPLWRDRAHDAKGNGVGSGDGHWVWRWALALGAKLWAGGWWWFPHSLSGDAQLSPLLSPGLTIRQFFSFLSARSL